MNKFKGGRKREKEKDEKELIMRQIHKNYIYMLFFHFLYDGFLLLLSINFLLIFISYMIEIKKNDNV